MVTAGYVPIRTLGPETVTATRPRGTTKETTMIAWFKKTWMLLLILIAATVICGPCARWFGPDFAQVAIILDNLAGIALILLCCDFVLDNRESWGFFPALDLDYAIWSAQKTPTGAALVFIGAIALLITILFLAVPNAHGAPLDNARPYLPALSQSIDRNWPDAPLRHVPAGQVEQESSWKTHATLKTSRELGRGLVQMTIAYDKSGRERFNIYREAARSKQLAAWNWQRDPYNVAYQLTFLILQDGANFRTVRRFCVDDAQAWKCALVCYNAGEGRWLQRLKNARREGLPADRWDVGLDRAYGKKETALLYGRPLYEAVNEYPRVIFRRAQKYAGLV